MELWSDEDIALSCELRVASCELKKERIAIGEKPLSSVFESSLEQIAT